MYMMKTAKDSADEVMKTVCLFLYFNNITKCESFTFLMTSSLIVLLVREKPASRDSAGIHS